MPNNIPMETILPEITRRKKALQPHFDTYRKLVDCEQLAVECQAAAERGKKLDSSDYVSKFLTWVSVIGSLFGLAFGFWFAGYLFLTKKLIGANNVAIMGGGFVAIVIAIGAFFLVSYLLAKFILYLRKKKSTHDRNKLLAATRNAYKEATDAYERIPRQANPD